MTPQLVQGYVFESVSDEAPDADRNNTICKIVSRAKVSEHELMEYGPAFKVKFGDGYEMVAYSSELHPWYPTD